MVLVGWFFCLLQKIDTSNDPEIIFHLRIISSCRNQVDYSNLLGQSSKGREAVRFGEQQSSIVERGLSSVKVKT